MSNLLTRRLTAAQQSVLDCFSDGKPKACHGIKANLAESEINVALMDLKKLNLLQPSTGTKGMWFLTKLGRARFGLGQEAKATTPIAVLPSPSTPKPVQRAKPKAAKPEKKERKPRAVKAASFEAAESLFTLEIDAEVLTEKDVGALLKVTPKTVTTWRYHGIGPRFVRIAGIGSKGTVRYRREDVQDFLKSRLVHTKDQPSSEVEGI